MSLLDDPTGLFAMSGTLPDVVPGACYVRNAGTARNALRIFVGNDCLVKKYIQIIRRFSPISRTSIERVFNFSWFWSEGPCL